MSDGTSRRIGPWTLIKKLGEGGNATVWRAARDTGGDEVAVKVINAKKATREPYRRFVREITFLRSLEEPAGVLPLVDAYLPERPSEEDRPWLAMPIAEEIADALNDKPLETVVEAVKVIATTLARLAETHGVAHRDIKPGNLYELDGEWLVGDFGLITVPDVEELTRSGKALGPAHFTAYEMIRDPVNADPLPADVYSLAKTLWVLATEQAFPPEGHQVAETRGLSIADLRPHPHAEMLDRLIDRATLVHPEQRPAMADVARDLRIWSELETTPVVLNVSELRPRLLEQMASELEAEDLLAHRKELALAAVRRMNELFAPLNAALKDVHPHAEIDRSPDRYTQNVLTTTETSGSPDIAFTFLRLSQITSGPDYAIFALRLGRGLELTRDGELIFRSYVDVGHPSMNGYVFNWESRDYTAPVGSVEADAMLSEAITETGEKLREELEAFVENLPQRSG